jgi:hypothetical protein
MLVAVTVLNFDLLSVEHLQCLPPTHGRRSYLQSILLITQCHEITSRYHQVDGHILILTHFHPNFRTFKFTFGKLILGFFCIGVLLQMLQWGT